jgi:hypothetical protein
LAKNGRSLKRTELQNTKNRSDKNREKKDNKTDKNLGIEEEVVKKLTQKTLCHQDFMDVQKYTNNNTTSNHCKCDQHSNTSTGKTPSRTTGTDGRTHYTATKNSADFMKKL